MRRITVFIKAKLALLLAIAVSAMVGGATTGLVIAAIPDSNGQINACYKNSTQVLRVTDPAANCAINETPLSWASTGVVSAYGHFLADGTLDSSRSSSILSFSRIFSSTMGQYAYCIDLASAPKSISSINEGYLDDTLASLDPSSQAWASISDGQCPANTDAVITAGLNGTETNSMYVTFY